MADGGGAATSWGSGGGVCMGVGGGDGAAASWGAGGGGACRATVKNERHLITILVDCNKCTVEKHGTYKHVVYV